MMIEQIRAGADLKIAGSMSMNKSERRNRTQRILKIVLICVMQGRERKKISFLFDKCFMVKTCKSCWYVVIQMTKCDEQARRLS